jgi:HMG box factor
MPQVANLSLSSPEAQGFQLSSGSPIHNRIQNGERMSDAKRRRFSPYPIGFGPGGRENLYDEGLQSSSSMNLRRSYSHNNQESAKHRRQSLPHPHQVGYQVTQSPRTSVALRSPPAVTTAVNVNRPAPLMGPPPLVHPLQPRSIQPATPTSARLPLTPYGLPIGQGPPLTRPDEALRLPPLQTSPMSDGSKDISLQVMSLNFIAKIKLLRAVAAPLGHARQDSTGTGSMRGAIIAIEGEDWLAVDIMKQGLQELLSRDFDIQIISGPPEPRASNVGFASYMQMISEWHEKRSEFLKFLTGADPKPLSPSYVPPEPRSHGRSSEAKDMDDEDEHHVSPSDSTESMPSRRLGSRFSSMSGHRSKRNNDKTQGQKIGNDSLDAEVSPKGINTQSNSEQGASPTTSTGGAGDSITDVGSSRKIPLLLIPHYILHAANAWASALPINDTYSPADHWQWVATLWRGIIGPDFTVYVHSVEEPDTALPPSVAGARPAVDIREELGALIVRCHPPNEDESGSGLRVEEGSIRRVAFEVGEWARGASGLYKQRVVRDLHENSSEAVFK